MKNLSTVVRILELNMHTHRVVWRKEGVSFLLDPSVVRTFPVFFFRTPVVVSSAVRLGISWKTIQRLSKGSGNGGNRV